MRKNLNILFILVLGNSLFAQTQQNIPTINGNIHLKIFGEGEPLLIINGGPGMNSDGFQNLARIFGESYKTIIYDQRGTGRSVLNKIDTSTVTLDLMIKDIEIIREHLGIERWIILGHSFGGMLASYYAANHSERLTGLILSSSGGINLDFFSRINIRSRLTQKQRDSLDYYNRRITRGDTTYYTKLQRGRYLAPAYLYDKSNVPIVAERLTQGNSRINGLVYQNLRRIGFDCSQALKGVEIPVLIIQGKDELVDSITAETTSNAFNDSEIIILENCGHYGWLDRPDEYFKQIYSYIDKVTSN